MLSPSDCFSRAVPSNPSPNVAILSTGDRPRGRNRSFPWNFVMAPNKNGEFDPKLAVACKVSARHAESKRRRKWAFHGGRRRDQNCILLWNFASLSDKIGEFDLKLSVACKVSAINAGVKRMSRWASYGGSLPAILEALESVHEIDKALEPWKDGLNNKERTIILKEQKDWRRAFEIFDWFRSKQCYEINVIHYNVMLRMLGKAQRWNLIAHLWREMQLGGVAPTNSTYGTLIDAYCKGGLEKAALLWLGDMCKRGMVPDEVTMGVVLQVHKKAREFGKAELFFKRWSSELSARLEDRACYSLYTYNTMIDTYGKAGQLGKASDTFAQMLREGIAPDIVTFNTMIHICGSHGQLEEVASLMIMMEELRCIPDTRTYNILISLYLKNDDVDVAERYFWKMKAGKLVPDTVSYRTLLYAYSIRGMVWKAEALVREMDDEGLVIDEYTQSALTRMYVHSGMLEQSWCWFERFCDTMSSDCFSANIDAFGEQGHTYLAEKAFMCCLNRKMLSVLVCNVMIKAYGIGKKFKEACELVDGMERYGISPDSCSYSSLIQFLSAAELPKKALYYVRKMQTVGLVIDCILYSMVIGSFAKLGEFQMAQDLFLEMQSSGIRADIVVYSILIDACAEVANVQQAAKYLGLMKKTGFIVSMIICNSLIKLYTKVGYLREARETYDLLKSLDNGANVYASNCMIDLYSDHSMVKEAQEVFENLRDRGRSNEFSYAMMMCLYKKVGLLDESCRIAEDMQALGLLTEALSYNSVIGLYASSGRMREAVQVFQKMLASNIRPNDATFKALGVILLKRGVSKHTIKNLELVRRNDARDGLHQWYKTLSAVVGLDESTVQNGGDFWGPAIEIYPSVTENFESEQRSSRKPVTLGRVSNG